MIGNPEAYAAFKVKLETLPENIVVIASHTQTDSRKEKVSFSYFVYTFSTIPPNSPHTETNNFFVEQRL